MPASRTSRARRAVRAGVFATATMVGSAYALTDLRPWLRDPDWARQLAGYRHRAATGRPVCALIGTSRAAGGVWAWHLAPPGGRPVVHNFARAATTHFESAVLLRRLAAERPRPAAVLLEVIPGMMADPRWADQGINQPERLSTVEAAAVADQTDRPRTFLRRWAAARLTLLPAVVHQGRAVRRSPDWPPPIEVGHVGPVPPGLPPEFTPDRIRRAYDQARRDWTVQLTRFHVEPSWDRQTRATLAFCRDAGLPVAVFFMPESPEFRRMYRPGALAEARAHMAGLATEYGATFWDCTEWLDEADTFDGHHSTNAGADKFSRRFGRECVGPWLAALDVR